MTNKIIVKETNTNIFLNVKYDTTIKMCMIGKSGSGKTRLLTGVIIPLLWKEYKFIFLIHGVKYQINPYKNLIHENHQFYCQNVDEINSVMNNIKEYAEYLNTEKVKSKIPSQHRKILIICDDLGESGSKSSLIDDCFIKHRHLGIGIIILGQKYTFFSTTARGNCTHFSFSSLEDIENMLGKTYKLNFPHKLLNEIYLKYNDEKTNNNLILHLDDGGENRISIINKNNIVPKYTYILDKTYSKINYAKENKCNLCSNKEICNHIYDSKSTTYYLK
jgi:hypothetical protein